MLCDEFIESCLFNKVEPSTGVKRPVARDHKTETVIFYENSTSDVCIQGLSIKLLVIFNNPPPLPPKK